MLKKAPKSPYLKTTYSKDLILHTFETPFRRRIAWVGVAWLIALPFLASSYVIHIFNLIAISAISALALNMLSGNAGLLSLGHAGFLAAGTFITAIFSSRYGMPIYLVLPISAGVGAVLGLVAGLPSKRLKGMYLGLSTLALHYVIIYLLSEYQFYGGLGYGITIEDPGIGSFKISNDKVWYYILCGLVIITAFFVKNLLRTRLGRAWIAIHNRDIAAELLGINIGYYKILAFIISTSITTMAGSIYAYYTNVATVDEYSFGLTINYLAMIIVGGIGSILGSIMGACLITSLPFILMYLVDYLQITGAIKDYFFAIQTGLFGLIIIIFLIFEPLGLVEIWRRIRVYFELWPFKFKPLSVTRR